MKLFLMLAETIRPCNRLGRTGGLRPAGHEAGKCGQHREHLGHRSEVTITQLLSLTYHSPRLELNSAGVNELHQLPEYVGLKLLYPNIKMGAALLAALIPRFGLRTFM